jgi:hypothetical protein
LALAGAWFGHTYYERHYISSDIRRILTAAMDPNVTKADVHAYLREARLKVGTQKDAQLLQSFESALNIFQEAENRAVALEALNASTESRRLSNAEIDVSNAKLEEEIAELQGKPINHSRLAAAESIERSIRLSAALTSNLRNLAGPPTPTTDEINAVRKTLNKIRVDLGLQAVNP